MINKSDLETALTVVSKMLRQEFDGGENLALETVKDLIISEIDEVYNRSIEHKAPVRKDSKYSVSFPVAGDGISSSARKAE